MYNHHRYYYQVETAEHITYSFFAGIKMKYKRPVRNRIVLLVWLVFIINLAAKAQSDTSFWFAAPAITPSHENTPIVFQLSTYDKAATITISEPANPSFTPYTIQLGPYSAQTITVTGQIGSIENKPAFSVLNYGIHITATANISAYYDEGLRNNPEIFPLKGSTGAGKNFLIPAQTHYGNWAGLATPAHSGFIIVASQDNTTITITLSKTVGSNAGGTPFTITLNKGQTYAVVADGPAAYLHLGGSFVHADKPVNVTIYDDSVDAATGGCSSCGCKDLIGDQIVPIENTGREFIITRGALAIPSPGDYYYVWATEDNTTIAVNSVQVATINKGQSYEGFLTDPTAYVVTSGNVYLYQLTGTGCEMASTNLPSIKCTGSQLVSFVRTTNEFFQLNLLCKTAEAGNFLVNDKSGVITTAMFQDVPGTNGVWKAARIDSTLMRSIAGLSIDDVFPASLSSIVKNTSGLFHLGFLNGGSTSGGRLGYFSNYATVQTSPVITSSSCIGSNIQLSSTKIAGAAYSWTGPGNFTSQVYNPVIHNATISSTGTYYLTADLNGCGTSIDSINVTVHPLPGVTFNKPLDTLCYGSAMAIRFKLTGAAPWSFAYTDGITNDTITNITQSSYYFSANPLKTTVYKVLEISDGNACEAGSAQALKKYDTLVINPLPVADFTTVAPSCEKSSVVLTDNSTKGLDALAKWTWIFAPGDTLKTNTNSISRLFDAAGNHAVQLTVQSSLGCISLVTQKDVLVNPLPQPGFNLPEICLQDAFAKFTDTTKIADNSTGFTYTWNFGDSLATPQANTLTTTNTTVQHHYQATASYRVVLKVTSADGCVDSIKQSFTVNGDRPKASVSFQNLICSNTDAQIINTSSVNFGAITKMEIMWGDTAGVVMTDDNPYHNKTYLHHYPLPIPNNTDQHTIKLVAYSGISCKSELDTVIGILPSPIINFNIPDSLCLSAAPYTITGVREINVLPGNYTFMGNGVTADGIITPALAGTGTDSIKGIFIADNGCRDTLTKAINILPVPTVNAGPDQTILTGASVLLTATASGTDLRFSWTPSLYLNNSTLLQPVATPLNDVTYILNVTGTGGCTNSDSLLIKVLQNPSIPNAFSPNGDGINDKWQIKYLDSYPNCEVRIFNRSGQVIFSSVGYAQPWDGLYKGSPVPVGTYYYVINTRVFNKVFSGPVTVLR